MRTRLSILRTLPAIALVSICAPACSDDAGQGGDTIVDATDAVDTSDADVAETTEDTEPAETTPDTAAETTVPDTTADTRDDAEVTHPLALVINELAAAGEPADWVELFNAGDAAVDLTGWLMRDDDPTHAYVFPAGTVLQPGAYLVVSRDETGASGFDFGLGGADAVLLYDPGEVLVDQTSWLEGESPAGASWGRFPNASGAFKTLLSPTPGAANVDNPATTCGDGVVEGFEVCDGESFGGLSCVALGWGGGALACIESCMRISQSGCTDRAPGLVVNEVESDERDRIEILNGTAASVDLAGYTVSDTGGGSYVIAAGTTLAAGAYLVLERDINHTFGLGDEDGVTLRDPDGALIDETRWPRGGAIPSWCRTPDGVGGFRTCDDKTFGNANF